jgi:hypothetical protein
MQIFCPQCQAQLGLPDNAAGKQARCPSCQTVFAVTEELRGPAERVQTPPPLPLPEPATAVQERAQIDDDAASRRRDDEDDDDTFRRRRRYADDEREIDVDQARARVRRPVLVLYVGCLAYLIDNIVSVILGIINVQDNQAFVGMPEEMIKVLSVGGIILNTGYNFLLNLFIFLGARNLSRLQGKGLVIVGVIMCFVTVLGCVLSILVCMLALAMNGNANVMVMMDSTTAAINLVVDSVTGVLLLVGGIMGITALSDPDVHDFFAASRSR